MTYIIMKLISGERIMAEYVGEASGCVDILSPLAFFTERVVVDGVKQEELLAKPYCSFSIDDEFSIPKTAILYYKELHPAFVKHYVRLTAEYNEPSTVHPSDVLDSVTDPFGDSGDKDSLNSLSETTKHTLH